MPAVPSVQASLDITVRAIQHRAATRFESVRGVEPLTSAQPAPVHFRPDSSLADAMRGPQGPLSRIKMLALFMLCYNISIIIEIPFCRDQERP
jgi:hypothetical protein